MAEGITNNASSTLNGAINNSVTSLTVTNGSTFPASNFRILVDSELMFVGTRSGNTFSTITRGIEGTTAASHSDTVAVTHIVTAASLVEIIKDNSINATFGVQASIPSAGNAGNQYFGTDALLFNVDNGSSWDTYGPVRKLAVPNSGWSWANQGSATYTVTKGVGVLEVAATGSHQWRYRYKALPGGGSGDYTVTLAFATSHKPGTTARAALILRDNADGDAARFFAMSYYTNGNLSIERWWTDTSYNNSPTTLDVRGVKGGILWLRFRIVSSSRYSEMSMDGIHWFTVDTQTKTDWMTPNEWAFGVNSGASAGTTNVGMTVYHHEES